MPQQAKVTMVIPVYNPGKYFDDFLNDLAARRETEVILVEDCSTDGSREKLIEFAKGRPNFKVILHEENMGIIASKRDGVMAVTTPYIMFGDDDDRLPDPDAPHKLVEAIEKNGTDMMMFPVECFKANDQVPDERIQSENNYYRKQVFSYNSSGSAMLTEPPIVQMFTYRMMNGVVLWSKIFKTQPVQKAYMMAKDVIHVSGSEDHLAFFLISCNIKTISTYTEGCFFRHRMGDGLSTRPIVSKERFDFICSYLGTLIILRQILEQHGLWKDYIIDAWND